MPAHPIATDTNDPGCKQPSGLRRREMVAALAIGLASGWATTTPGESLDPDMVAQTLEPRQLRIAMLRRMPLLVLDVRERVEFDVSHLPGARFAGSHPHIITVAAALARAGPAASLVCYCTIGWRSREIALQLGDALSAAGPRRIASLEGGIMAWHDLGFPLVDAGGETPYLHPHDDTLASRMTRPAFARFASQQRSSQR